MKGCPHCHSSARKTKCRKCKRVLCVECICTGEVCGSCYDETARWAKARKAKQTTSK